MIYAQLFFSFLQVGLFSIGGGYAAIPFIRDQVVAGHPWLTMSEFTDLVTIAEMTPGPIGLNCATFAGMRVAGIMGSVISMLGMLMPTFTVCALAAVFFQKFKDSKVLKDIMLGVRPTALGIIFAVMITLSLTNYTLGGAFSLRALAVGILALVLLTKGKWSVPKVIVLSALLGLQLHHFRGPVPPWSPSADHPTECSDRWTGIPGRRERSWCHFHHMQVQTCRLYPIR